MDIILLYLIYSTHSLYLRSLLFGFVWNGPVWFVPMWPTLEGAGCLLSQGQVLLRQVVHWLVLVDLHTGADITIAVQEEGEGAGKMLTVKKTQKTDKEKELTYLSGIRKKQIKSRVWVNELRVQWTTVDKSQQVWFLRSALWKKEKSRDWKSPSLSKKSGSQQDEGTDADVEERNSHLTSQYSDLVESKTTCMFAWKRLHPQGLHSQLCRRQRIQSRPTLPVSEEELPSSTSSPPLSNTQQLFACNNTCLWKSDITTHTDDLSAKQKASTRQTQRQRDPTTAWSCLCLSTTKHPFSAQDTQAGMHICHNKEKMRWNQMTQWKGAVGNVGGGQKEVASRTSGEAHISLQSASAWHTSAESWCKAPGKLLQEWRATACEIIPPM